ncbi:MAG: hypothetical protein WDO70_00415 [Alphaproteobacteria bacterium]
MTLLVPQKKIPMRFWWEWSDIVYDQMGVIQYTLAEHDREKEADFFRYYRSELKALWLKTQRDREHGDLYRHNYAMVYRRFLRELPDTSKTLQDLLHDDWRGGFAANDDGEKKNSGEKSGGETGGKTGGGAGGFRTMRGAEIFGYPDYDKPRGIADGWPRPGYLPFVMRNMILGQVGFLYLGALKPREGATPGNMPVLGYDAEQRYNIDQTMLRRTFQKTALEA